MRGALRRVHAGPSPFSGTAMVSCPTGPAPARRRAPRCGARFGVPMRALLRPLGLRRFPVRPGPLRHAGAPLLLDVVAHLERSYHLLGVRTVVGPEMQLAGLG